jgi:hypothetical protein
MWLPTPVVLSFTLLVKLLEQSLLTGLPKGAGVGHVVTGSEDAAQSVESRVADGAADASVPGGTTA